jgi:hypothetical protein
MASEPGAGGRVRNEKAPNNQLGSCNGQGDFG